MSKGLRSDRVWNRIKAEIEPNVVTVAIPPTQANTWFISLTDERGGMITSPIQFQP
jgi:hypothetical protein